MSRRTLFLVMIMVVLWGSHHAVATVTMHAAGADPLSRHALLFFKLVFGVGCLFLMMLFTGRLQYLARYSAKRLAGLVLAGVFGYFLYYFFLFWGLERATPVDAVAEASIINYLFPLCTLLASAVILREKLTWRALLSGLISFVGVLVLITRGDFTRIRLAHADVDLMVFAAAISWGVFSALARKTRHEPLTGMFIFLLTGLVISGVLLPFTQGRHVPHGWEFYGVFHIGFLCNTLAAILWIAALRESGASLVGNLALLAAFVNLVFIRILLPNQTIGWPAVAGLALIIVGVLVSRAGRPRVVKLETSEPQA